MSPVHLRNLGFQRNQPQDIEGLSRNRRPGEDTLDTVVDGKTLRKIIPTLQFTFQFNRNLKPEDWKDMDQVLQRHKLLKDLFKWSMDKIRFNVRFVYETLDYSNNINSTMTVLSRKI
ncbi:hypothetical protein O181_104353 [Austropuccinia psidii MF-1]|uniref:Uncharacterized protein n=1 Tax=Austropuccinia psidii MF-1 TaxID=1389203 RepID=A0A9Q3JJZ2_9BASI|nr:hypothetical protein [Austropuccinia psidii MF-1]